MAELLSTYIQRGTTPKKDLFSSWGILLKTAKLINIPKLKEPHKRSWLDEQGDDEYLPEEPTFQAYTVNVEFAYIGAKDTFQNQLRSFCNYLQGGEFNFFDVHYKSGIRCRYDSYDETYKQRINSDIFIFTIVFKVNQPLCVGFYTSERTFTKTSLISATYHWSDGVTNRFTPGTITHTFPSSGDNFVIVIPDKAGDIFTD